MRNFGQPACDTAKHRRVVDEISPTVVPTRQPQPELGEKSWIARAMSWLGASILEGFAIYGESMCGCWTELPENYYHEKNEPPHTSSQSPTQEIAPSQPARLSHDVDIQAWLTSAPSRSPRDRRWLRLAAIWPKRRAATRTCGRLIFPDDPTPPDGGVEHPRR
jgi:hypothetical protein